MKTTWMKIHIGMPYSPSKPNIQQGKLFLFHSILLYYCNEPGRAKLAKPNQIVGIWATCAVNPWPSMQLVWPLLVLDLHRRSLPCSIPVILFGTNSKTCPESGGYQIIFRSMILIMTMNVILSYLGLPQYKTEAKPMRSLDPPSACTELELLNMKVCINGGCHKLSNNR